MGFRVTEEQPGRFLIVDAGGLRLCVDAADGSHAAGSSDPIIGFHVFSLEAAVESLAARSVHIVERVPAVGGRSARAQIREPDGRLVVLTEGD